MLAIGVGAAVAASGLSWGFGRYREAVRTRRAAVTSAMNDVASMQRTQLEGELATRRMGEHVVRSLPPRPVAADRRYARWLLDVCRSAGIEDPKVDPRRSQPVGDVYHRLSYQVTGRTTLPSLIDFLHAFYAKDWLHRISSWSMRPSREGGFALDLSIDAAALKLAPEDLPDRDEPSYRVAGDLASYRDPILNRNPFGPPNEPPVLTGPDRIEVASGESTTRPLSFIDPEMKSVRVEVVEPVAGDSGLAVELDAESGSLFVDAGDAAVGEATFTVRAVDDGLPPAATTTTVTIAVTEPPMAPEPPPEPLKYDDAKQTVLTGLTRGRGDWQAWLEVRPREETLKVRVGDEFEIGSVKASVKSIDSRRMLLDVDGDEVEVRQAQKLKEAVDAAGT